MLCVVVKGSTFERAAKLAQKIRLAEQMHLHPRGKCIVLPFDGCGWDGSLTAPILRALEGPAFEKLVHSRYLQLYLDWSRGVVRLTHVSSPSVLIASRRKSGGPFTSIGNPLINCQLQQMVVSYVFKIPYDVIERLQSTEGDDHSIALSAFCVTTERVQLYCSMMATTGIVPKSLPYAPFAGEGEVAGSSCSSVTRYLYLSQHKTVLVRTSAGMKGLRNGGS